MAVQEIRIPVGDLTVGASLHGEGGTVVVLGHGAGGDRRAGLLVRMAEALAGSIARLVRRYHDAEAPSGRTFRFVVAGHPVKRPKKGEATP